MSTDGEIQCPSCKNNSLEFSEENKNFYYCSKCLKTFMPAYRKFTKHKIFLATMLYFTVLFPIILYSFMNKVLGSFTELIVVIIAIFTAAAFMYYSKLYLEKNIINQKEMKHDGISK